MNGNIAKLEKILGRFKLRQPVPLDIQKQILSFKRKTTVNVLKNFGEYNAFYGSVLRFYFFTKKIGVNLTARQAEITLSFISAALIAAGILTAAGIIIFNNPKTLINDNKISVKIPAVDAYKEQRTKVPLLMNRLGITQILSDKTDEKLASDITDKLYSRLKGEMPAAVVFRKTDGIDKSVNRILTGRLSRAGNTYLLSVSIANAETGKILFDKNYTFKEADQINGIINTAAENIGVSKEIW
ncbi:MAG: hypothetical protein V1874_11995 [Spirochaetota bacterium]